MRHRNLVAIGLCVFSVWPAVASAENDCVFVEWGSTLRLTDDCTTDATLSIPDGMTLDGRGHRITAVDPPSARFTGAVIEAGGGEAHVRRLTVDTDPLATGCNPPGAALRGILFDGASGSVVNSRVLYIRQAEGGCQEGHAVEVRGSEGDDVQVSLVGNHIEGYQKTGVLVVGDVEVTVTLNHIVGLGAVDRIAQNGIQLSAGAVGSLKLNHVESNLYLPGSFTSSGILLLEAGDGVEVSLNRLEANDVGIFVVSTSRALLKANRIEDSTYDAIAIDGRSGAAEANLVAANHVRGGQNGVELLGAGARDNHVTFNRLHEPTGVGIQLSQFANGNTVTHNHVRDADVGMVVESDENEVTRNLVVGSATEGIRVTGADNLVERNLVR